MPSNWGNVQWKTGLLPLLALTFASLLLQAAAEAENSTESTRNKLRKKSQREDISKIPHVKKTSCSGRKCKLDLSLIATNATEIAVPMGLNQTRLKAFKTTGKTKKKGHWNGETAEYSYLNLLKQGAGPNGMDLWFGNMYDGEEDVHYDISPDANGTSIIATARRGSELPPPMGVKVLTGNSSMLTTSASSTEHSNRRQLADDGSVIDIMYVWTLGAECKASGLNPGCTLTAQTEMNMRGKIDSIISFTNTIYFQSGISTQLRLVYAYRHPTYKWDYQNNCGDALNHVTRVDGQLDDVLSYRAQYRADLVQLITVPCSSYCGIGWVSTPLSKDFMFSVVTTDCLGTTPAHEIGHNQGCNHDRASGNQCSDTGYNFGYKDPVHGFRDVMSYDCPDCTCNYNCGAKSCPTVARISNTKFLYNGFPIGNAQNNCAQTINDNRVKIASFFDSLPPQGCSRIEENIDYVANDIGSALSASAEGCCSICSKFSGCQAFAWSNFNGGTCWLKSGKGSTIVKSGVRSAVLSPSICTPIQEHTDYVGNLIGQAPSVTAVGCCSICNSFTGCKAYTWTTTNGGSCWLKSGKGSTVTSIGFRSAVLGSSYCAAMVNNVDYWGNDFTTASSTSADGCCLICKTTSGCKAFTWNSFTNTCWLKTTKSTGRAYNGAVAGTVWL